MHHSLIFNETQLARLLKRYLTYFNHDRPHQGLGQHLPVSAFCAPEPAPSPALHIVAKPILNGLHHAYQWAAA